MQEGEGPRALRLTATLRCSTKPADHPEASDASLDSESAQTHLPGGSRGARSQARAWGWQAAEAEGLTTGMTGL